MKNPTNESQETSTYMNIANKKGKSGGGSKRCEVSFRGVGPSSKDVNLSHLDLDSHSDCENEFWSMMSVCRKQWHPLIHDEDDGDASNLCLLSLARDFLIFTSEDDDESSLCFKSLANASYSRVRTMMISSNLCFKSLASQTLPHMHQIQWRATRANASISNTFWIHFKFVNRFHIQFL